MDLQKEGANLANAFRELVSDWRATAKTPTVARKFHQRVKFLHADHDAFYRRCVAHNRELWGHDEYQISLEIRLLERRLKYAIQEVAVFTLPHRLPTPKDDSYRSTILNRAYELSRVEQGGAWAQGGKWRRVSQLQWLRDGTAVVNEEWKIFLGCDLALEQLVRSQHPRHELLCAYIDKFLMQCVGQEAEYAKCYEPWVGEMLEKLAMCQDAMQLRQELLAERGTGAARSDLAMKTNKLSRRLVYFCVGWLEQDWPQLESVVRRSQFPCSMNTWRWIFLSVGWLEQGWSRSE